MHRRTLLKTAAVTPLAAAAGLATAAPAEAVPRVTKTLASGLNIPWGLDFLPDGSGLCCMRNDGRLIRIWKGGGFSEVATLPSTRSSGEGGALGLAVSPQFATDRRVYAYYSTPSDNRVAWFTYTGGVLGEPERDPLRHPARHRSTTVAGSSSPATAASSSPAARPVTSRWPRTRTRSGGKILRLDRDGNPWPGNPFIGTAGDDRIFSYGHRNPQGIDQAADGRMWACELGQDTWDELNQVSAGHNYGWADQEGRGRSRRLLRPAGPVAPGRLLAERDGDPGRLRLHRRAARAVAVAGRHQRLRASHQGPLLQRDVRPDPHGQARPRRLALDHHRQRWRHRPGAPGHASSRRRSSPCTGRVAGCGRPRLRLRDQAAPGDDEHHRQGARPSRDGDRDRRPRRAGGRSRPVGRPDQRPRVTGRLSLLQGEVDRFAGADGPARRPRADGRDGAGGERRRRARRRRAGAQPAAQVGGDARGAHPPLR